MIELVLKGQNDQPVTTSLMVAQVFGKEHSKVMRDIDNLTCSPEFRAANFGVSSYISQQNKELPMSVMTKDGFSFLVMGYTGKKASKFKEDFIAAFNAMEAELKKQQEQKPLSQLEILVQSAQMLLEQERKMATMQHSINSVESRLNNMEREQRENQRLLKTVELSEDGVPSMTLRNQVRQLVNKYSKAQNVRQDVVWNKIYEQLYYIYGISIRAYKRGKGETQMDVAERIGCVEKMHAIISNLIREVGHQKIN